jgi:hypothetical protein
MSRISDTILKFCIVAQFLFLDLKPIFHMKYIHVSIIYFRGKCYVPSTNCSSVMTIKLKAEETFCENAMTIYILENIILTKVADVFKI